MTVIQKIVYLGLFSLIACISASYFGLMRLSNLELFTVCGVIVGIVSFMAYGMAGYLLTGLQMIGLSTIGILAQAVGHHYLEKANRHSYIAKNDEFVGILFLVASYCIIALLCFGVLHITRSQNQNVNSSVTQADLEKGKSHE